MFRADPSRLPCLLVLIALSGCAIPDYIQSADSQIYVDSVGGNYDTDYAIGQEFRTRRDLFVQSRPMGWWREEFDLTSFGPADEAQANRKRIPSDSRLRIDRIDPPTPDIGGKCKRIYARFLEGPLVGRQVYLGEVSRELRFVDPEFLSLDSGESTP